MADKYTYDEEVVLISDGKETPDSIGDAIPSGGRYVSYAQIVSPFMRETYEALARGLKPEFVAVLPNWYDDYHGERELEYNGLRYRILRAYMAKDLSCELTVTRINAKVPDKGTLASGLSGGVL